MMRIALFLGTNIAVLVVLGIVCQLIGLDSILDEQGIGINYTQLLGFAAVFGFGGSLISLAISKWMAKRSMGAKVIENPRGGAEAWLVETVSRHAKAAGIGMPEVAIYESPQPNAFATGARRDHALVAVSTGLLQSMKPDEVDGVLAHEVSHVANGDMITLALVQGVVNTFVIFLARVVGVFVDRTVFRTERGVGPGYYIVSIVAQIVFGILASTIVMWFSRRREFRADAGAARLTGREKMIAALERLKTGPQEALPDALNAYGISGGVKSGLAALFSSHPPLEERIERLRSETGMSA